MADIRPFRGLRFKKSIVKDLAQVICPPYDIISPSLHEDLHRRSIYNFIRIEDARSLPQDTIKDNKYTRAASVLQRWMAGSVLYPERTPALYLHDHYFQHRRKEICRRGLTVRIRLEEWESGFVRPHEGILAAARDDRLNLLWALQVNTSPVLAMYEDHHGRVSDLLAGQAERKPVIDVSVPGGERHCVRLINNQQVIDPLQQYFEGIPIYIADGHHRYTSALTYRREKMSCTPDATPDDPFNFVMVTLVSFSDPGLIILAPHRLIRGIPASTIEKLETRLTEFFEVEKFLLNSTDAWQRVDLAMATNHAVRFACLMTGSDHVCVLTLKPHVIDGETMPLFHTELYRQLDVSIIDHIILEKILGLGVSGQDEPRISFSHDRDEAIRSISRGEHQIAFFVKPVNPELIKRVADAGEKMPRKSTYFYPKAPAGLVVNPVY